METLETERELINNSNNRINTDPRVKEQNQNRIDQKMKANNFYVHSSSIKKTENNKVKFSIDANNINVKQKIDFSNISRENSNELNSKEKLEISNPDNSKCDSQNSSNIQENQYSDIKNAEKKDYNNNLSKIIKRKHSYKPESTDLLIEENKNASYTRNKAGNNLNEPNNLSKNEIFNFESNSQSKSFHNTLSSKNNVKIIGSVSSSKHLDNKININFNEDKEVSSTTKPTSKPTQFSNDLNTISTNFNPKEENYIKPKVNYNRAVVLERWAKTKRILKGVIAFQKMSENIQLFGVSDENFDDNKYLKTLKSMRTRYIKDKQDDDDERKDSYQSLSLNLTVKSKPWYKTLLKKIKIPVFMENNLFIFLWSVLIGFLMVYVVFITPYTLAFSEENSVMDRIEAVINFVFIADILINFNLSYRENTVEITDRKMIAIKYIKSWFILDVLASFPFEYIKFGTSTSINLARSNKIIRVARISKIYKLTKIFRVFKITRFVKRIKILNSIQDYLNINYGLSRLITFIVSSCLFSHIVGCIWYFVPVLYDEVDNWVTHNNLNDEPNFRKYLFSLYWSFTTIFTVGFGDITPVNEVEYILTIIWILFGVAFYSFTIGTLSTILVNMNTKTNLLSRNLSIINDYCKDTDLSEELMKEMKRVITFRSNNNIFSWIEKQEIFNNLPANLKCSVSLKFVF